MVAVSSRTITAHLQARRATARFALCYDLTRRARFYEGVYKSWALQYEEREKQAVKKER